MNLLKLLPQGNKIFFLLFFICISVYSQKYPNKHFNILNGLPNNAVRVVFKDSNGLLWVGTDNGLVTIKNNEIDRVTVKGKSSAKYWDITQDDYGNLWFATYGSGLIKFNGTDFKSITTDEGLVHNHIRKVFAHQQNVFVGTHNGISILQDDEIYNIKNPDDTKKLQIQDFFEYKNEVYAVAYLSGVFKVEWKNNEPILKHLRNHRHAFSVGYFNDTIFQSLEGEVKKYNVNDYINNKKPNATFGKSVIWDYAKTNDDKIFASAWGVHTNNGSIYEIVNDQMINMNELFGVDSNEVWSLFYDKDHDFLYVGTQDKGLYKVNLSKNISLLDYDEEIKGFETILNTNFILTNNGIKINKEQTSENIIAKDFIKFQHEFVNKNSNLKLVNDAYLTTRYNYETLVFHQIKSNKNTLWVATNSGLFQLNDSGKFMQYYPIHLEVFNFTASGDLICPVRYNGINLFLKEDWLEQKLFEIDDDNTPTDVSQIFNLSNETYIISQSRGLFQYKSEQFINILKDRELFSATIKSNKEFYIAKTNGVVLLFNREHNKITDTILNSSFIGNTVKLINYYKGNLIITTEKGVNILNKKSLRFINEEQGIVNKQFLTSNLEKGILKLGTTNGWYSINVDNILNQHLKTPQLELTQINVNHTNIFNNEFLNNKHLEKLKLNHNENTLEVSWFAKDYKNSNKLKYRYRVNGLNNKWSVELENSNLILPYLPSGNFNLEIETANLDNGNKTVSSLLSFSIATPYWKAWWFYGILILVFIFLTVLIYKIRLKKVKEKGEIRQRLVETKLEALQSQMNPHFAFNAMNSIQNYIIDSDVDNALLFLTEFSRLIRTTLEHSSKQRITLDEEIEFLKSYIAIENMRFNNSMTLKLQVDNQIDIEDIKIPPMLLQPIVENSVVHGFTSKTEIPTIYLDFQLKENLLIVTIQDNGQGIKPKRKTSIHKSKGINLIKERLQLIQNITKPIMVESDSNGTITTITLEI